MRLMQCTVQEDNVVVEGKEAEVNEREKEREKKRRRKKRGQREGDRRRTKRTRERERKCGGGRETRSSTSLDLYNEEPRTEKYAD